MLQRERERHEMDLTQRKFDKCGVSRRCYIDGNRRTLTAVAIAIFFLVLVSDHAAADPCPGTARELWAYNNPSTETFEDSYNKYLSSDKGSECQWLIISSHKQEVVELRFTDYKLKNTSGSNPGDCLYVYDGPSREDKQVVGLCSSKPKRTYMSTGRELLVVYRRGKVTGKRSFSMTFVSKEVLSKEKMIRIAGIVGACIAVAVLAFITLRATRCCHCLLQAKDEDDPGRDIGGSALVTSARERDRLTQEEGGGGGSDTLVSVAGMRREARRVHGSVASVNRLGVSADSEGGGATSVSVTVENGGGGTSSTSASPLAPLAATEEDDAGIAASDDGRQRGTDRISSLSSVSTGSSHGSRAEEGAIELPPSYESLFLDENGDYPVEKPPDYSPPRHRSKHPPRRVHTFN